MIHQAISSAILLVVLATHVAGAAQAEDRDPARNAALQYWSALVYLPDNPLRTQWEVASSSVLTASLEDAEFLLKDSGIATVAQWALDDLRRGAKMPYCEWGLPLREEGPDTILHHVQRSGTATGLLVLSARLEHSHGNCQAALNDLNTLWVFQRHIAHDGTLVSWSKHLGIIEHVVAPLAASWLPDLEESAIRQFRDNLKRLPESPRFSDVLLTHRDMWTIWLRQSTDRHGLPWAKEWLVRFADRDEEKALREALETALTSKEALYALIEETRQRHNEAARIASLPLDEFKPAAAQFQREIHSADPLTRLSLGTSLLTGRPVLELRYREADSRARLAMLQAAIALRLEGQDGFKRIRDPYGDGPFEYQPTDGGYTLTSELTIDGKPSSMRFGKGAAPAPLKKPHLLIYNPKADAAAEIRNALRRARQENKRVLLQWGFNGCIPCYALHRTFDEDDRLSEILRKRFIHLPIDLYFPGLYSFGLPMIKPAGYGFRPDYHKREEVCPVAGPATTGSQTSVCGTSAR